MASVAAAASSMGTHGLSRDSRALSRDNSNMRAWFMDSYDGVEKLRLAEAEEPKPGPGEVALRVRYVGLNPADAFLARGMYPAKPALPHILGRDAVGEVVAAGPASQSAFCAAMWA
jgi:D-arabinose 1-dehydrogenase-like Zn-dependent alcohol dehydrogenase